MNATATTNPTLATGTILALDLGQYKSVACHYHRTNAECRFQTLETSYGNLRCLFERHRPALVVFEALPLADGVGEVAGTQCFSGLLIAL